MDITDEAVAQHPDPLQTIQVSALQPGMYVQHIDGDWLSHSMWRTHFLISDEAMVARLCADGIQTVQINLAKGKGLPVRHAASLQTIGDKTLPPPPAPTNTYNPQSLDEESQRARFLRKEAIGVVRSFMAQARSGEQIELATLEPTLDKIIGSVNRNADALTSLLRLKSHDEYTYEHCISVTALAAGVCMRLGFDLVRTRAIGMGALLHDIGKSAIPESILGKPGRLSTEEMERMKGHTREGFDLLRSSRDVADEVLDCILLHHERMDGQGYPFGLASHQIPEHVQIVAIADAYDAMTSDRCYRKGLEPTVALNRIHAGINTQFNGNIVSAFIRTLGVYPVGSLLRLSNGYLATVSSVDHQTPLKPVIRVFYDTRSKQYIPPYEIDLARKLEPPKIISCERFEDWGIARSS